MDIFQIAAQFRKRLIALDQAATDKVLAAYQAAMGRLLADVQKVLDRINTVPDAGLTIGAFYQFGRLRELQAQLGEEIQKLGGKAAQLALKEQQQALILAERQAHLVINQIGLDFKRLPKGALNEFLGLAADGSELKASFERLALDIGKNGGETLERAIIQGIALGYNPEKIVSQLRKELDAQNNPYKNPEIVRRLRLAAHTGVMAAYRESTRQIYAENGLEEYVWSASKDSRTCFPKGTIIETTDGRKPIEQIKIGDLVLTHTGKYQKVKALSRRKFSGELVEIKAGGKTVIATAEHPFLVKDAQGMQWREAKVISKGDNVVLVRDRDFDQITHGVGYFPIERKVWDSDNLVPFPFKESSFPFILDFGFWETVPINAIHLQDSFKFRKVKINWSCPAMKNSFLKKWNFEFFQNQPSVFFRFSFPLIHPIALSGTMPPSLNFPWASTKRFRTIQTLLFVDRSSTKFRTVISVPSLSLFQDEWLSAPFTFPISNKTSLTFERAKVIPVLVNHRYTKFFRTSDTLFFSHLSGTATVIARTLTVASLPNFRCLKTIATFSTSFCDPGLGCLAVTSIVREFCLMGGITLPGAIKPSFLDFRGESAQKIATFFAGNLDAVAPMLLRLTSANGATVGGIALRIITFMDICDAAANCACHLNFPRHNLLSLISGSIPRNGCSPLAAELWFLWLVGRRQDMSSNSVSLDLLQRLNRIKQAFGNSSTQITEVTQCGLHVLSGFVTNKISIHPFQKTPQCCQVAGRKPEFSQMVTGSVQDKILGSGRGGGKTAIE